MTTSEPTNKNSNLINLGIGIPAYGFKILNAPAAEMYLSLGMTLAASEARFLLKMFTYVDVCGVDVARNRMVQEAIDNKCDWLLMIDADTWHPDGFNILQMISGADRIGAAVVVGPTPKRDPKDTHLMVYQHIQRGGPNKFEEEFQRIPLSKPQLNDQLKEIDSAATAMMAININWLVANKFTPPWFKFVWTEGSSSKFLSEDLYFCNKVKELGGKIFADGRFICNHLQRPEII